MPGWTAHDGHWRARWRAKDYSWSGLAKRRWRGWWVGPDQRPYETASVPEGSRPATLQDYWRSEEGRLIEGDGLLWTRAHCPLAWSDGSPTPKASWTAEDRFAFEGMLTARLAEAAETSFHGSHLFREVVGVDRRAQFHGCVLFGAPQIANIADAYSARFEGAYFVENARFQDARFIGDVYFAGAVFAGECNFLHTHFDGEASFDGVTFAKNATFNSAVFGAEAGFDRASFERGARFEHATFRAAARFTHVDFLGYAGFDNSKFEDIAQFDGARFANAHFNRTNFAADARFEAATFESELDFRHAAFLRPAVFSKVKLSAEPAGFSGAFRGARFADVAEFTGAGANFVAAFDEAIFDRKLLFDEPPEEQSKREFDTSILTRASAPHASRERLLKELEGGCRTVKVAMGRERDEAMEQRYYRYQLIARRKQAGTPLAEKLFSHLYATFSDYGMGLWQPFATILALTLGFGALYWGWGEALRGFPDGVSPFPNGALDPDAWDAMLLSANNVFRPFGVWSAEFHQNIGSAWIGDFLSAKDAAHEGGQRLAIRLVATLQSILAVILFFLFGLAVRRRFQIG